MAAQKLFGTSGIRGNATTLFTNQFCFDIGRSFAIFLDRHKEDGSVAVGMDPRPSSPRIKNAFIDGLIYEKRNVYFESVVPVPAINWLLIPGVARGGAMITGSHINLNLNGIKFFAFKEEILKEHEREIEEIYSEVKKKIIYTPSGSEVETDTFAEDHYLGMLTGLSFQPYPNWRVVVDPGNGAQYRIIPRLFGELGIEATVINDDPDLGLIVRDTEQEGSFAELQKKVVESKADFGIGYDTDGDRVVFVDEKGAYIPGDYIGTLLAKESESDTIVTPFGTSQVIEMINKKVIRTKVGSPYVVEAMKKSGSGFGFEANGGAISSEIMLTRDGGSTTVKVLNLLKKTGLTMSQLVLTIPRFFLWRDKIACPRELNNIVLRRMKEKFVNGKFEELDGLKIWLDKETWILFRPSKNAEEFRVFSEAKDQVSAKALTDQGIMLVREAIASAKK